jgi:hypothetical protein
MRGLKDGPDGHPERLSALVALPNAYPSALALELADAINAAAMRANGTVRPKALFEIVVSRRLVVKVFVV